MIFVKHGSSLLWEAAKELYLMLPFSGYRIVTYLSKHTQKCVALEKQGQSGIYSGGYKTPKHVFIHSVGCIM